jgi:hypothetical protein
MRSIAILFLPFPILVFRSHGYVSLTQVRRQAMLRGVDQYVARRIKELLKRTGILPVFRLPDSGPLRKWWDRHVFPSSSWGRIQTMAGNAWTVRGLPQEALVVVNVPLEAKHGSGVWTKASLTYASGLLSLKRAQDLAETLKEQGGAFVVPINPGVNDGLFKAHLNRRKKYGQDLNPEILTTTTPCGSFPYSLGPNPLAGREPLPPGVRFSDSSQDDPTFRQRASTPKLTPPFAVSPVFG